MTEATATTPQATLGGRLHARREQAAMTLAQLSAITKIPRLALQQIEADQFSRLPGGILIRGYVRAFAAAVGLDPEDAVRQLIAQHPASGDSEVPSPRPSPLPEFTARRHLAVLAVCAAAAWALMIARPGFGPAAGATEPATLAAEPPPIEAISLLPFDVGGELLAATTSRLSALALDLEATGACWVAIVADGQTVVQRLLGAGEQLSVDAVNHLWLRVGAPDRLLYRINGQPGRSMGRPGAPVTIEITPDNYDRFVDAPADGGDGGGPV